MRSVEADTGTTIPTWLLLGFWEVLFFFDCDLKLNSQKMLAELREHLVEGQKADQQLTECHAAFRKLPVVPKVLYTGHRGGEYYINERGNKVYLNGPQKERRLKKNGYLPGVIPQAPVMEAKEEKRMEVAGTRKRKRSAFSQIEQQLQAARQLR
jgi:hypothetical protein